MATYVWAANTPSGGAVAIDTETISVNVTADSNFVAASGRMLVNGVEVTPREKVNGAQDYDLEFTLSEKDLWYGAVYTVQAEIKTADGDTGRHAWTFTVASGVSKRVIGYQLSHLTQQLANNFPEWSRAQSSDASVLQQLVNPICEEIASLRTETRRLHRNHFLQTADRNDLSLLYRHSLGESFKFNERRFPSGDVQFVAPTMAGIYGLAKFTLTPVDNIWDFWNIALPDRVYSSSAEYLKYNGLLLSHTDIKLSPLGLTRPIQVTGHLHVEVTGVGPYAKIQNESISFVEVKLTGTTEEGWKKQEEVLVFERAQVQETRRRWKEITEVQVTGADFATAEVAVWNLPPRDSEKVDYDLQIVTKDRETHPSYWQLGTTGYGSSLLQSAFIGATGLDVLGGEKIVLFKEFELQDVAGNPVTVKDFCLDRNRNFLYAANESKLFIFDKRPEYFTNLDKLRDRTKDPGFNIGLYPSDTARDQGKGGLEVDVRVELRDAKRHPLSWRWSVYLPDGTLRYITKDGALDASPVPFQRTEDPLSFSITSPRITVLLTQTGTHLFRLETNFRDGTKETTLEPFQVDYLRAVGEYDLAKVYARKPVAPPVAGAEQGGALFDAVLEWGVGKVPEVRLVWDSDDRLRLLRNGMMYTLGFGYDTAMVDFENKELFFRVKYDSVRVT